MKCEVSSNLGIHKAPGGFGSGNRQFYTKTNILWLSTRSKPFLASPLYKIVENFNVKSTKDLRKLYLQICFCNSKLTLLPSHLYMLVFLIFLYQLYSHVSLLMIFGFIRLLKYPYLICLITTNFSPLNLDIIQI